MPDRENIGIPRKSSSTKDLSGRHRTRMAAVRPTHGDLITHSIIRVNRWWSQSGSNRRPLACHASALPAELWPHVRRILKEYFCVAQALTFEKGSAADRWLNGSHELRCQISMVWSGPCAWLLKLTHRPGCLSSCNWACCASFKAINQLLL